MPFHFIMSSCYSHKIRLYPVAGPRNLHNGKIFIQINAIPYKLRLNFTNLI